MNSFEIATFQCGAKTIRTSDRPLQCLAPNAQTLIPRYTELQCQPSVVGVTFALDRYGSPETFTFQLKRGGCLLSN
jgi:hypothetical protein